MGVAKLLGDALRLQLYTLGQIHPSFLKPMVGNSLASNVTVPFKGFSKNGDASVLNRRILIIDDDDPVREVIHSCLEDMAGWQVESASSGQEGLGLIQFNTFDVIVLDMMMPEMDGTAFLRQLRANPATRQIPVVILTAKVDWIEPGDLEDLAVEGIIAKPFDPILLVQQIAEFLGWLL